MTRPACSLLATPLAALVAALMIGGCAAGAPTVDLEPIEALPAEMPVAWFAENWGPFDASLVGDVAPGPGGRPLLIQDGVQVSVLTEMRGDVFAALTDPDGDGGFMAVRVFKHPCDTRHFGPAGVVGVIMVFSVDYEGPLPGRGHRWDGGPCDGGGP